MRYAGPRMLPALAIAGLGAVALFFSSATWLEVTGATVLLVGAALIVYSIATPEFVERDLDDD